MILFSSGSGSSKEAICHSKDGRFRGANTFQHDVDVVIEVPEKGKAVAMGRFNQGGEINIFENEEWSMAA